MSICKLHALPRSKIRFNLKNVPVKQEHSREHSSTLTGVHSIIAGSSGHRDDYRHDLLVIP